MLEAHHLVSACHLAQATSAAIAACDGLDGVRDGLISAPRQCHFDSRVLIGTRSDHCAEFTAMDADIIRKIWQGPRARDGSFLWYGLQPGTDLSALNASDERAHTGAPFSIALDWYRYFLTQDPQWDWRSLNSELYEHFWEQSVEQYSAVVGTDNPDLSAFRRHGGKSIVWHGEADPLIFPEGTVDYVRHVQQHEGGIANASTFIRLFMAPGVEHCQGGNGPQPTGALEALIRWVEQATPPDTLLAVNRGSGGEVVRSRPLCPFPSIAIYKGRGSVDNAANFQCGEDSPPLAYRVISTPWQLANVSSP
jgi:hypothetical protein